MWEMHALTGRGLCWNTNAFDVSNPVDLSLHFGLLAIAGVNRGMGQCLL